MTAQTTIRGYEIDRAGVPRPAYRQRRPAAKSQRNGLQQGEGDGQQVRRPDPDRIRRGGQIDQHHRGHRGREHRVRDGRSAVTNPLQYGPKRAHRTR